MELNEELLEEEPRRTRFRERVRLSEGLLDTAFSESEELEDSDLGGEGCSRGFKIRSYGNLVRNGGTLVSALLVGESSLVFFGMVSAQFSQGIALFLSFSSYVLRKLESRRWLFAICPVCNAITLGLSGGVSMAGDALEN